jgi:hypothetical protein
MKAWLIPLSDRTNWPVSVASLRLREGESGKQVIMTSFTTFALREFCAKTGPHLLVRTKTNLPEAEGVGLRFAA